jgi:predicted TIM-barrel fold metal-dependent hydrolase
MRRLLVLLLLGSSPLPADEVRPPIIDMHLHALPANAQGPPPLGLCAPFEAFSAWDQSGPYAGSFMALLKEPPCDDPLWSPETDAELMHDTLEELKRLNVIGVVSGLPEDVAAWCSAAPERLIPALSFTLGGDPRNTPANLRADFEAGRFRVFGEIGNQYAGIAPDDERMEPYWALAEELDIPVGIHIGPGPPGAPYLGTPHYRARLHSPLTLEEVLVRHPGLRIYVMHAGFPMLDDMLAVLYAHPQVYVDLGVIAYTQPRAAFYRFLRGLVEGGFGKRIMFGSDQMVWPGAIERAITAIREAPFLTEELRRDIFYENAARFLRLDEEERARHDGLSRPPPLHGE